MEDNKERVRYGLDPADARSYSREETARLLGLSPGAVYDAEQRAIATLRQAFRAEQVAVAGGSTLWPEEGVQALLPSGTPKNGPSLPGGGSTTSASTPSNRPG